MCRITHFGSVFIKGMLLADNKVDLRPRVTLKRAFISGSSKQGKERLASVFSNCVTAKYLKVELHFIKYNMVVKNYRIISLGDAIFNVRRPVKSA